MGKRIAYLSGPVDAEQVYRDYREQTSPAYFGTVYLAQLLGLLDDIGAKALIITTLPERRCRRQIDHLTIVNLPIPEGRRGAVYHFAMMAWAARCLGEIIRFRPAVALLTARQDYFWMFRALSLFGIRLMVSLHGLLWPKLMQPRAHLRLFSWLNGTLVFPACEHIQAVSQDALDQVTAVSRKLRCQPRKFVPTYARSRFEHVRPPSFPAKGELFKLLYVGRIEANKGVFDLLEMMRHLEAEAPGRYRLDFCGSGSAHDALLQQVADNQLAQAVGVHGECNSKSLIQKFASAHAVIVPTRRELEEGYNKVAAEAVLNLRPVVTSAACPALSDVHPATVEVRPDDVHDYVRAVQLLANDPEVFAAKVRAAEQCREIYFDQSHSYGAVLTLALNRILAIQA
jgi:glycogen synthase